MKETKEILESRKIEMKEEKTSMGDKPSKSKRSSLNKKKFYIVDARKITKIYDEKTSAAVHALKEVDFRVKHGEVVAVMGESGCGKTTLLNCISGIDSVTSGEVFIDGVNMSRMKDRQKTLYRALNMGFIFQTFNLIPVLTALENVELPLLVTGTPVVEAKQKALRLLEMVGLEKRLHHKPNELSGGERQRVTIARSLVNDPAVVWADEPTGNLDSKTAKGVMKLLIDLNVKLGATIVMVTHSEDIAKYAQRIVMMQDGRIL